MTKISQTQQPATLDSLQTTINRLQSSMTGVQANTKILQMDSITLQNSVHEILAYLKTFATNVEGRFNATDQQISELSTSTNYRFNEINGTLDYLVTTATTIKQDHRAVIEWQKRQDTELEELQLNVNIA